MASKTQKKVAVKKVTKKPTSKPAVAAAPKVVSLKVAPAVVAAPVAAKRTTKPAVRKRKPVSKKPAQKKVTRTGAAAPVITAATPTLYPAPHYTRWTLATLGEFYLIAILFSLFVLGIIYWCTAMSQFWSIV